MQNYGIGSEKGNDIELEGLYKNPSYKYAKELCYVNMVDEQTPEEKQTIMYLMNTNNFKHLKYTIIRKYKVDESIADDIMIDIYEELSRKEDYRLMWDEKDPTKIIPIEGYIHHVLTICAKRYFSHTSYTKYREMSSSITTSVGNEESLFDFMPDKGSAKEIDDSEYDLTMAMEWAKTHRYTGHCDLLAVIYARMVATSNEAFKMVLRLLGISIEAESKLESWMLNNEEALYFITSVVRNREESIECLHDYVYGAELVRRAVEVKL